MSELISIKDQQFRPYITEDNIANAVKRISDSINKDLADAFPVFLAVLNGSFMFASDLLKEITIPCEISFIKLASYTGTSSTGMVTELIGLSNELSGRTVVILEDIVDTGLTINELGKLLNEKNVKQIKIATVLMKPESYKGNYVVDYVGIEIKNDFVIGYGLDYDGQGRNLREIYVLV